MAKAVAMEFPCPMCVHNPDRYEQVKKGTCTTNGHTKVANVLQHLISRHLHICRDCTQVLIEVPCNLKSATRYNDILAGHKNCVPQKWPKKYDTSEPEILTKAQQAIVLDTDKAWASSATRSLKGAAYEVALYKDLYKSLHNKPLREGGEKWTYMVPGHMKDRQVEAANAKCAAAMAEAVSAKRKLAELERDVEQLKEAANITKRVPPPPADVRDLVSRFENDPHLHRPPHLDISGERPQYVNPRRLLHDANGPNGNADDLIKLLLEEDMAPGKYKKPGLSIDSGFGDEYSFTDDLEWGLE